jgi:hypothetical protein
MGGFGLALAFALAAALVPICMASLVLSPSHATVAIRNICGGFSLRPFLDAEAAALNATHSQGGNGSAAAALRAAPAHVPGFKRYPGIDAQPSIDRMHADAVEMVVKGFGLEGQAVDRQLQGAIRQRHVTLGECSKVAIYSVRFNESVGVLNGKDAEPCLFGDVTERCRSAWSGLTRLRCGLTLFESVHESDVYGTRLMTDGSIMGAPLLALVRSLV